MHNDNCNYKVPVEDFAVPAPTEPMKAILGDLYDILTKSRDIAGVIEGQLFESNPSGNSGELNGRSMYEALISMRMIAKETAEILYSINQRIEG